MIVESRSGWGVSEGFGVANGSKAALGSTCISSELFIEKKELVGEDGGDTECRA